ncbi:MAG TPA: hypothetical protein PKH21_04635 [Candidatus Cloacimonadota bacterium]|nr:hypothetical protein [Candidatus Cloacimonadota bacterium]HOF59657.1 hypothetical protein [Candidatus Cloacimonadota bacterium]HQO44290.1 hypothetical protein [Candidatus Cloacimonadota bacterium]
MEEHTALAYPVIQGSQYGLTRSFHDHLFNFTQLYASLHNSTQDNV